MNKLQVSGKQASTVTKRSQHAMTRRSFDIVVAALALFVTSPILLVAAVGILVSSPGPVLYRARRVGLDGKHFEMLKLRSMDSTPQVGSVITAPSDPRVFPFGAIIRKLKIDELPQFVNVLRGEMSIVGPRPEDPRIVKSAYSEWMMETLSVRPGLTSPGALLGYCFVDGDIDPDDPEASYVQRVLSPKLALERAYIDRADLLSDLAYILRTVQALIWTLMGRKVRPADIDIAHARNWMPTGVLSDLD